jgi:predicted transcriptional regulator
MWKNLVMQVPKRKLSDMVFQRISPPDTKSSLTPHDLSAVLVRRLGLKRKESRAQHDKLLLELLKYRKENMPVSIEKISQILQVSQSQTYEEIRKWRSLGLIEFVKIPAGDGFLKGYMLTGSTVNRLLDKAEASAKSFFRKTRRIAKDFDDLLMLGMARDAKGTNEDVPEEAVEEPEEDN